MRAQLWKLHQWLGLLTCCGVILWGLSGVMHPIMSRLQPKPAQFNALAQAIDLRTAITPAAVLAKHHIAVIEQWGVASVQRDGQSVGAYRVQLPGQAQARYFAVIDGQEISDGDRLYAEQLARHYAGLPRQPVQAARLMTQFDDDYPSVNKLLPVWRIDFAEPQALRVYIDTSQARLATLSNDRRRLLTTLFRIGHNWSFFDGAPLLQVTVMSMVLACVVFSALSGIYFYAVLRPSATRRLAQRPLTRWHRGLGVAVAIMALTSASSGAYHLLHAFQPSEPTATPFRYAANELDDRGWQPPPAITRLSLARIDGQAVWQFSTSAQAGPAAQVAALSDEHAAHRAASKPAMPSAVAVMTMQGERLADGPDRIARQLAMHYAGRPANEIVMTEPVTQFGGEYGFFFKRLPVYKVQFGSDAQPRYYVDIASGALAAKIDDWDALEGKSFAYLHKWSFTEAGRDLRDVLLALFAFGNVLVAGMGLTLFIRRRASINPPDPR